MPTLFSYCIPYDNGAAPNPFWGFCTLAICKPQIRLHAEVGDWVVGTGSVASPIGNVSGMVVYAMLVTEKMTMEEYDRYTQAELPDKIPLKDRDDRRRECGDSIYDYSTPIPSLRPSVHSEDNQSTDLDGYYVLLSDHFFYFGDSPEPLPEALLGIVKQGQGHKSRANAPYFDDFVRWIHSLGYPPGTLIGEPQGWSRLDHRAPNGDCTTGRRQEAKQLDCNHLRGRAVKAGRQRCR